jgi:hypothetical protein
VVGEWLESVAEILFDSSFMTLATADDEGLPWASPVEFVCDEDLRFYWLSMVHARHSQNVRENPWVAFSIYDCMQTPSRDAVQGLYGEGPVEEFLPSDLEALQPSIRRWISWRDADRETPRPRDDERLLDPDSPWRFYRVNPTNLYALDPVVLADGRLVDSRVPVDLTESFTRAYRSRNV